MTPATYRYTLTREIGGLLGGAPMLFVMLNPSTADEHVDDPTIRRCIGFARRERAGRMTVVNLFAVRSTDPKGLADFADPVGPDNDRAMVEQLEAHGRAGTVVVAWGGELAAAGRMDAFARLHAAAGAPTLWCLGLTKSGMPRHPLMLRGDAPLSPWSFSMIRQSAPAGRVVEV